MPSCYAVASAFYDNIKGMIYFVNMSVQEKIIRDKYNIPTKRYAHASECHITRGTWHVSDSFFSSLLVFSFKGKEPMGILT